LNTYKSKTIKVSGEGKEINILIESNENTFEKTYDLETPITKFNVTLGAPFVDILGSINQELTFKVPKGRALECSITDVNKNVDFFVAMVRDIDYFKKDK
jgi:hypothetical protein